ncbi:MAG: DUF3313 family protein [Candidatus Omnitrophota bacterium]|nr:DUF3313 family protein [Candidatus Omnitrophota bacterium]
MSRFLILLAVTVFMIEGTGCATKPVADAGFVDSSKLQMAGDVIPFQKAWTKPGYDPKKYTEVYIVPVNIDYLFENSSWKNLPRGNLIRKDAGELATYMHGTFIETLRKDPNHRLKVVTLPTKNTVILELAITELVPNKIALKTAGLTSLARVGRKALALGNESSIAFEARFRDYETWEVVALITDREKAKLNIVNIKNFTWYAHVRSIIDEWAEQLVDVLNKTPESTVRDSRKFEIKPW